MTSSGHQAPETTRCRSLLLLSGQPRVTVISCYQGLIINLSRVSLVKRERIVFLIRRYMLSQSSSLIKSRVIERFELHVIKKSVLASRKSSKHQL